MALECKYLRPSQKYPNWDFWFENIPSGNSGFESRFRLLEGELFLAFSKLSFTKFWSKNYAKNILMYFCLSLANFRRRYAVSFTLATPN
jgi:hypothetical protein